MGTKRKSGASHGASAQSKKIKQGQHSPEARKSFYQSTLTLLLNLKEGEEQIAGAFIKLPSKKFYPDYYHVIKNPISINEIQKKITTKYTGSSSTEFLDDFELLLDNASTYNDSDSWIVVNAKKLVDFVKDQVSQFENAAPAKAAPAKASPAKASPAADSQLSEQHRPTKIKFKLKQPAAPDPPNVVVDTKKMEITNSTLSHFCQELLDDVINHSFKSIGVISGPFLDEVDQTIYTEYSKFVKKPMAFRTVADLIKTRKIFNPKNSLTQNLQAFHDTVVLIFSNARAYNSEDSQIYQDAVLLEKYFEEQYAQLKSKAVAEEKKHPKLKLNLNRISAEKRNKKVKEETNEKDVNIEQQQQQQPPPPKEQQTAKEKDQSESESESIAEAATVKIESENDPAEYSKQDGETIITTDKTTENTMGKSFPTLLKSNSIIQETSVFSSPALVPHITKFVNQKIESSLTSSFISREMQIGQALFPTHSRRSLATLFSYKIPANGYVDQSYVISLPSDVSPFISFKVSLHHLLYLTKKPELVDGHGFLSSTSDEEFQCKLLVNDEEVLQSNGCFEEKGEKGEKGDKGSTLSVQYDIKLNHDLNILNFECTVAPSLSKKIKNTILQEQADDLSGCSRHTRHQLQQMKMTWDVETINLYIICNSN
ncbi:hypothetical protein KGF56_004822 [Candida oxycetoniae]|uniref:Bromo domain-containing protein n=1 Tax=Candida oxycetoniae TaxID=497107 RepID=A0AAI9SSK0_9ASCO|nr:uncharacterized protein KGF56_004822 [Candida oxycetoniae]KAI3402414.2 hypothetical protein KGF56_004822 [Candida oxycetoniae]